MIHLTLAAGHIVVGKERVKSSLVFLSVCIHARALTPVTSHMSSDATCSALHKFKSSLGTDTGECHASDCYKDSSPSVQSQTHTHTYAWKTHCGQQTARKHCQRHCKRWGDKRGERIDSVTAKE